MTHSLLEEVLGGLQGELAPEELWWKNKTALSVCLKEAAVTVVKKLQAELRLEERAEMAAKILLAEVDSSGIVTILLVQNNACGGAAGCDTSFQSSLTVWIVSRLPLRQGEE